MVPQDLKTKSQVTVN